MPPAARRGDITTGHGCFGSVPIISGSNNVLINNIPVARQGDGVASHTCGDSSHGSVIDTGSSSVKAGGQSVARIADLTTCGDVIATGSGNVIVGG